MPRSAHYGGHGDKVWSAMGKTYGDTETRKRVFYATENKRKSAKKRARKRGSKK